jgi:hypothetical protein
MPTLPDAPLGAVGGMAGAAAGMMSVVVGALAAALALFLPFAFARAVKVPLRRPNGFRPVLSLACPG